MRWTFTALIIASFVLQSFGTNIQGFVRDASGEPVFGATIHLKNTSFGATAGLDGSFLLKNVPASSYTIVASMMGYTAIEKTVVVAGKDIRLDFVMEVNAKELGEIVVKGIGDRELEESTIASERKADNVVNIIGAKTIQLLPDVTVGNVLQRVSGVSVVRNGSGDGQYAIIRGMDKRYNYTLVNGIKIPSPDNKNRYVPMDIFPADLLERLEVVKALTPNMEGDAIGGAMNMIMKNAPDYLTVSATLAGSYTQLFSTQPFSGFSTQGISFKSPSEIHGNRYAASPSDFSVRSLQYKNVSLPINSLLNFSIGDRILKHRLGVFFGGSFQHIYNGSNSSFFRLNGQPGPDPAPNTPIFESVEKRVYSNEQARAGVNMKFDYTFNERNRLKLMTLFMQLDEWQHRNILNNQLTAIGDVGISDRSVFRRQNISNATLQGDHTLNNRLTLKWSAAYSRATSITPNWVTQNVTYRTSFDTDGNKIESARYIDPIDYIWTHNEDRDLTGYLNFIYNHSDNIEISAGGMYRDKNRNNFYNDYELATVLPGGDRQVYTSIDQAIFSFRPESYAYADSTNANNYTAKEQVAAAYVQGKVIISRLQILGGVRAENTNQSYVSQLPVTATGKTGNIQYLDILPSIHFKYEVSDQANVRLSYFKGMTRPGFFELVPASFPGDYFTESGNYNLKHTKADNIDLRYEFFPGGRDRILIGGFYKRIQDPIEYGFNQLSQVVTVYTPLNFGTANNIGAELVFAKFFKKWGVSGNYTFTHSEITTTKRTYGRDESGNIVNGTAIQERPLQGQSAHIANLSLIFKDAKNGLDAQVTWVYTGNRINIVSPFLGLDYWQRGTSQLDFSAEKKMGKRFSVFVKATNLLNNPIIVEILKPNTLANLPDQTRGDRILVQKDVFQRNYQVGIRFKY